jgi:hypothetical protein
MGPNPTTFVRDTSFTTFAKRPLLDPRSREGDSGARDAHRGDWMALGIADKQKPAREHTVEA